MVDLLRELMERQALRRFEAGTVTPEQVERLGETFLRLGRRIDELREAFGLTAGETAMGSEIEAYGVTSAP